MKKESAGVEGGDDVNRVAKYLNAESMSEQVFKLIELLIQYTKDFLGVTDAALG